MQENQARPISGFWFIKPTYAGRLLEAYRWASSEARAAREACAMPFQRAPRCHLQEKAWRLAREATSYRHRWLQAKAGKLYHF